MKVSKDIAEFCRTNSKNWVACAEELLEGNLRQADRDAIVKAVARRHKAASQRSTDRAFMYRIGACDLATFEKAYAHELALKSILVRERR